MKVGYEIKNVESIKNKIAMASEKLIASQKASITDATLLVHETAIKLIQDNSDGNDVVRYNPTRTVKASFEGDPPNSDKGRLVQSIKFDFINGGLTGLVGTNLKYGAWLEFGTKNMQARPWLQPSVQLASLAIGKIFETNLSSTIKDIAK
jgi:phage gpG-like protein